MIPKQTAFVYVIKKECRWADECVGLLGAHTDLEAAKREAKNLASQERPGYDFEVHRVSLDAPCAGICEELFSYSSGGQTD